MDDGDPRSVTGTQPPMADRSASTAPGSAIAPGLSFTVVQTGTKYTSAALDTQVAGAMSKSTVGGNHAMSAASDMLGACVARVGGGKRPLLVDAATYEGRTATIIALPGPDTGHADVWVVGDRCSASDSDVLVHRQVAR
jgi:hypothetical protein